MLKVIWGNMPQLNWIKPRCTAQNRSKWVGKRWNFLDQAEKDFVYSWIALWKGDGRSWFLFQEFEKDRAFEHVWSLSCFRACPLVLNRCKTDTLHAASALLAQRNIQACLDGKLSLLKLFHPSYERRIKQFFLYVLMIFLILDGTNFFKRDIMLFFIRYSDLFVLLVRYNWG